MSLPSILIGLILSTLYGAIFHLWRGGNAGRLLLYLVLSWIGFWLGQLIGSLLNLTFDTLGQLHLVISTIGSFLLLGIGYWLSLVRADNKSN